jgi:hypothetical protein
MARMGGKIFWNSFLIRVIRVIRGSISAFVHHSFPIKLEFFEVQEQRHLQAGCGFFRFDTAIILFASSMARSSPMVRRPGEIR